MLTDRSQTVYMVGRMKPGDGVVPLGTAFAIDKTRIATALHVVGMDDKDLVLLTPKISNINAYQDTSDRLLGTPLELKISAADPLRDLCVLDIIGAEVNFNYVIGSSDGALVGDEVFTLGFPHANFGRTVLTQYKADVGARVLIQSSGVLSKHLVLNTQAREGQSGGPVFNARMDEIVGMLIGSYALGGGGRVSIAGVDPATLHQTTHAVSAEYLVEML